jgi:hypothetical protein
MMLNWGQLDTIKFRNVVPLSTDGDFVIRFNINDEAIESNVLEDEVSFMKEV